MCNGFREFYAQVTHVVYYERSIQRGPSCYVGILGVFDEAQPTWGWPCCGLVLVHSLLKHSNQMRLGNLNATREVTTYRHAPEAQALAGFEGNFAAS